MATPTMTLQLDPVSCASATAELVLYASTTGSAVGISTASGVGVAGVRKEKAQPLREVTDGVLNQTTTIASATADFSHRDIGRGVAGTGIPAGAYVVSVSDDGASAVISAAATATATGVDLTLGTVGLLVFRELNPNSGSSDDVIDDPTGSVWRLVVKPNSSSATQAPLFFTAPDTAGFHSITDHPATEPGALPPQGATLAGMDGDVGGTVGDNVIQPEAVTTSKLADAAVETDKLADGAVTEDKVDATAIQVTSEKDAPEGYAGLTDRGILLDDVRDSLNAWNHGMHPTATGAENRTALQAAVTAAIAEGKPLFIPAGTYTITFSAGVPTITVPSSVIISGAGRGLTVLNCGPNQPTFAHRLFTLATNPAEFALVDMTINGPADPTRGGQDYHSANMETAAVWNQASAPAAAGRYRFERLDVGGKYYVAFQLTNGDVDMAFVDCDITAYCQCVSNFDSSSSTSNAVYGPFVRSDRWFVTERTHFHDAGIPPWTAGEDAGGIADSTGVGHLIYPHPNVNTFLGPGTRFSGGVNGKYAYAIHTGSGVRGSARQCIADGVLFEGPGGGFESNERGLSQVRNCTFTARTGLLVQNDIEVIGCTFEDSQVSLTASAAKRVRFKSCSFTSKSLRVRFDAQMTSGSAVLTLPANSKDKHFTSSDVNRSIIVDGAGAAGAPLVTTISTFTSASQVTLAATASTTVTAAQHKVGRTQLTSTHLTPDFSGSLWEVDDCDFLFEDNAGGITILNTTAIDRFVMTDCRLRTQAEFLGSMTSGSAVLTATSGVGFTVMDIGKSVLVYGAGAAGAILSATIQGFTDSTHVTLSSSASTTVSGARVVYRNSSGAITANGSRVVLSNCHFEGTLNGSSYWIRATNAALTSLYLDDVRFGRMGTGGDPIEVTSSVTAGVVRGTVSYQERKPTFATAQYLTARPGLWGTDVASAATLRLNASADSFRITGTTGVDNIYIGSESADGDANSTKGFAGKVALIMASTAAFSSSGNIRPNHTGASTANSTRVFQFDPNAALWYELAAPATQTAATVAFTPAGSIAATTVQAAIEEVATEAGGGGTGDALIQETIVAGSPAASIAINSIPGTYRKLRIEMTLRGGGAGTAIEPCIATFNADSADANYDREGLLATSNTATASAVLGAAGARGWGNYPRGGTTANNFGEQTVEIKNYASTTKNKVARIVNACPRNRSNEYTEQVTMIWYSTAAITDIVITPGADASFAVGSIVTVYGVT